MADVRISNLAAAVAANLDGNSLVPTTDSEGTITTVKVTLAQLRTSLLARAVGNFAATDYLSLGGASPPATGWIRVDGTTVTSSTPILSAIQTWNQGATVFTGLLVNITNTSSSASSLLVDLQVGGFSKWKVDVSGNATTAGNLNTQAITCTTLAGTGAVSGFTTLSISQGAQIGYTAAIGNLNLVPSTGVVDITPSTAATVRFLDATKSVVTFSITNAGAWTSAAGGTITTGGLTVSAGTTAVQALTATSAQTTNGSTTVNTGAGLTTIFTAPGAGMYLISAYNTAADIFAFFIACDDGAGIFAAPLLVNATGGFGAGANGHAFQINNTSGTNRTLTWQYLRIN